MPYHSRPTVHTSWYGCRRRSHWSPTSAAKAKDSTELRNGRTTLRSTADARLREPSATSGASEGWSPRPGSNRRPLPYQGSALPAELRGRLRRFCRSRWSLGNHRSFLVNLGLDSVAGPMSPGHRVEWLVGREGIEPPQSKDG